MALTQFLFFPAVSPFSTAKVPYAEESQVILIFSSEFQLLTHGFTIDVFHKILKNETSGYNPLKLNDKFCHGKTSDIFIFSLC